MITDHQTNTVYLADTLAKWHQQFYNEFRDLLAENGVYVRILTNTKGIWAVDYMPQTSQHIKLAIYATYYQLVL